MAPTLSRRKLDLQQTTAEINAFKNACWEQKVPTDLIARFGKDYRGLPLKAIDVRAFRISGTDFPTNLKDADFSKADLERARSGPLSSSHRFFL